VPAVQWVLTSVVEHSANYYYHVHECGSRLLHCKLLKGQDGMFFIHILRSGQSAYDKAIRVEHWQNSLPLTQGSPWLEKKIGFVGKKILPLATFPGVSHHTWLMRVRSHIPYLGVCKSKLIISELLQGSWDQICSQMGAVSMGSVNDNHRPLLLFKTLGTVRAPGWLSRLSTLLLSSAQTMISGSWDGAQRHAWARAEPGVESA